MAPFSEQKSRAQKSERFAQRNSCFAQILQLTAIPAAIAKPYSDSRTEEWQFRQPSKQFPAKAY
jgi:hypothetical protein